MDQDTVHTSREAFGIRPAEVTERLKLIEVKNPPHKADEPTVEAAFSKEMESMVDKGDAFANERIKQARANLEKLQTHLMLVSRRVKLTLKAHHETVAAVRKQAEEINLTCEELILGHHKLKEALDKV